MSTNNSLGYVKANDIGSTQLLTFRPNNSQSFTISGDCIG